MKERTCPNCGKRFLPWRSGKRYCSERCRKTAENRRLGYVKKEFREFPAIGVAEDQNLPEIPQQNQESIPPKNVEDPPRAMIWIACNEVTRKLARERGKGEAAGWVMYVHRQQAWFSRVRDSRGNYSAGPFRNVSRAQKAVEAWIRHEPFTLFDHESEWRGDCWKIT